MPDTDASKNPVIEELVDGHLSPRGAQQTSRILSLSAVSGLNIACLAFITYHFATHPLDPMVVPGEHSLSSTASDAGVPRSNPVPISLATDAPGNVELVPAAKNVISIVSSFPLPDRKLVERREKISTTSTIVEDPTETKVADAGEPLDHWVQLGALSKETAAQRYWSALKLRHNSLLQDWEPHYLGPAEVNGSLYHVRLGPMTGETAAGLCEKLEAEGADCFCIGPHDGEI